MKFHFAQFETKRKYFSTKKLIEKYQIWKPWGLGQGPPFRRP